MALSNVEKYKIKYKIGCFYDASRFQFQLFPVDVTMAKVSQTSGIKAVERREYKSNNAGESKGSIYFGGAAKMRMGNGAKHQNSVLGIGAAE